MSLRRLVATANRFLLAATISSAAVASTLDAEEPVTVTVFHLPSKQSTNAAEIAEYEVTKRFQELHPGIRLQSATPLRIEGAAMDAAPLMAIAGGNSPDVIYVNFRQSDTFIQQGFLYPLDEYIAQMPPGERARRIPPVLGPVIHRDGPTGDSHYWAMPDRVLAVVLMYRKDHFAAAGLDPTRPPRDWAELRRDAEKVADPARGRYALGFWTTPNASWRIFPFISSAGADVVRKSGERWEACFNSPGAVEAFRFVDELQKATVTTEAGTGPLAYRGADVDERWEQGQISMLFGYLSSKDMGRFNPDLVGVGVVPAGPGGVSRAEVNAEMMGIYSGVKDKRVRDAAWEYIRFLGSPEALKVYTDAMVRLGAGQLMDPNLLQEYGYEELAKLSPPGLREAFRNAMEHGTPEPYGKNCQFIYDYVTRPLERIYYTDFSGRSEQEIHANIQRTLDAAVLETNGRMLGVLPPAERSHRNAVGWVAAAVTLAGFAVFIRLIFRWMSAGLPASRAAGDGHRSRLALFFIAPGLLLILIWNYYPLLRGSFMAFQDYKIVLPSDWVGIRNFADVLFDARFWHSLRNAFYFCALWMTLGFLPPVALAILLQEIPAGKLAFRLLFYLPAVVSGVVILFMWRAIYDPSPDGALNRFLSVFGVRPQLWLQDPAIAMLCVVFPLAWANLGPGSLIYLAALKGIPDELYEAADIDGAGFFAKVRGIVYPYLRPLLVINAVGATIFGFKSGDAVLAMTGGGPDLATQVVGYEIWQRSFLYLRFGEGTAMAWILGLLLMTFTAYQMRVLARVEFRTTQR